MQESQEVTVNFQFKWQSQFKRCIASDSEIEALVFFVSQFELQGLDNKTRSVPVLTGVPEQDSVALIRFEPCIGVNDTKGPRLKLSSSSREFQSLAFNIGLPFELNHKNPAVQPTPLNLGSMFWTWRLGYKFLRLDTKNWSFHLGSGGCVSPSAVRAPQRPCNRPNLPRVTIDTDFAGDVTLVFDLDRLLAKVVQENTTNCMDGIYGQPPCADLIENLGLSGLDGNCVDDCRGQQVIYASHEK